jgi:hypothetical protein
MNKQFYTRQQLIEKGLIDNPPYCFLSEAFVDLFRGNAEKATLYHSDVIYVRAALEKHTGFVFPLPDVEAAMKAEGWKKEKKKPKKKQIECTFVE